MLSTRPWGWLVAGALATAATPASAAPFAYVANYGDADGTVSVIDSATNSVVTTVEVGTNPLGVAVSPDGDRVYVTHQRVAGTVTILDAASNDVVGSVAVGAGPSGVSVKLPGTKVYVVNRDDKTVSVLDVATGLVIATIPVGNNPLGVAVSPAGTPAYVVNKGSDSVSVIDTNLDAVVATVDVGNDPTHVAVHPNGGRIFVSNGSNSSVSVIDAATNTVVATVPVGNTPEGIAFDPGGTRAYVANNGPNTVSIIDTLSNAVTGTVPVGLNPFDVTVDPTGGRVYVTNRGGQTVSVIDAAAATVVATVDVGLGPTGFGSLMLPALRPPVFAKAALACQKTLASRAAKIARADLTQGAACRLRRAAAAAGSSPVEAAEAACAMGEGRIATGRGAAITGIVRRCRALMPSDVNAPCRRSAATIAETAACVLAQHEARVDEMVESGFASVPGLTLGKHARACQARLSAQGVKFAGVAHAKLLACLGRLLRDGARGRGTAAARAWCSAALDVRNGGATLARAHAAAIARIVRRCKDLGPTDLGNPCDPSATTIEETATCVLAGHAQRVARMIAAEYNDACVMLTGLGLGPLFPAACAGP